MGQKWPRMKGKLLFCAHCWAWQVQAPHRLEESGEGPPGVRPWVGEARFQRGGGRPRPQAAGSRIASSVVLRPRRPKIHGEPQARSGASPGSPQPLGKPSMTPTPGCHILAHLQVPPQGPAWTCSGSWLSEQERRRRVFFPDLRRLGMRTRAGWRRRRQKEWASSSAPRRLPQPRAGGPQRGSRQTAASGLPGAVTQRPSVI